MVRRVKRKRRRRLKKKVRIFFVLILLIGIASFAFYYNHKITLKHEKQKDVVLSHYNEYVTVIKDTSLYTYKKEEYKEVGKIGKGTEISLAKTDIDYKTKYFKISSFDKEYYIKYNYVKKIDKLSANSTRYKKYIPYNKNIVTEKKTSFYDEDDNLIYTIPEEVDLPIIVMGDEKYGVEYKDRLVYVKEDDVKEVKDSNNTDKKNTSGIAVLNYHFFNDSDDPSDSCNQIICMSTANLKKHLNYIKDNDIFTPTMKELEMYIDKQIQLPKSIVLTIDDGWRAGIGSKVISEYELNATIFLMSKYYDPRNYENEYIEVHSHGWDIHNAGECPGGQGGAIKCWPKDKLLEDLNNSRKKLNNTTYFCYPFYEYNNYSISVLKEAGFTMAFGGYNEGGHVRVVPGADKFRLPRYVIYSYTTASDVKWYVG